MADGRAFSTPKGKLTIEKFSFQDEKERYKRQIEDHAFNHAVEIVIPDCFLGNVIQCFRSISPARDQFCLIELPVHAFTEEEFIRTFIKTGQFIALSWETRIDSGNCVAVLPTGVLILSLDKDTYEQLGLTGKPSAFQKKHRFIVEVNLAAPYFVPGKKLYERVRWCLKDKLELTFKFLMSWTNEGQSSTGTLHSFLYSYNGQMLSNEENVECIPNCPKAPQISFEKSSFTEDRTSPENCDVCDCMSFFEWLGCIACGVDCSAASPDSYVSTLTCPEPSCELKQLIKCRWTGMITSNCILSMMQSVRELVKSNGIPWIAVTVWGFTDCPVTWKQNEHGHFFSGENFYTFVIFPNDRYWLYTAMGSHDIGL
ncbi:ribonuclease P protein subunit p40-like [Orbicella faveolata]|uniref:ribonuclease P protein subunit p40-like n=1 Tax=Orbicella faveolata TaxID=48498 RepID=UPI0009E200B4|nr:ribonuclease P protein subunit p40-like [Orbicella faveolata]XP_020623923.1 ribonuclease P protein subunit p40-like [Orbicella faveolata]